jgi:hypothetical protein
MNKMKHSKLNWRPVSVAPPLDSTLLVAHEEKDCGVFAAYWDGSLFIHQSSDDDVHGSVLHGAAHWTPWPDHPLYK